MPILEQFDFGDVSEFTKDFVLVMNMTSEIDREYGIMDSSFLHNLPEYEECLNLFSKKYKDIILKPDTSSSVKNLRIFYDVPFKEIMEIALKMEKVAGVGRNSMSVVNSNSSNFKQAISAISTKAYLLYYSSAKSKSIILKKNNTDLKVELIYDKPGIIDKNSAEFKLCAYFGCLNGFDKSINLQKVASTFYKPGRGLSIDSEVPRRY